MAQGPKSQFNAENVLRLAAVDDTRRLEIELSDAEGAKHVVSLPLGAAIALARLICDFSEVTPFLKGKTRSAGSNRN